jgi:UDP-N-acetylmuramate dehydrogenase
MRTALPNASENSLRHLNTFGFDVKARELYIISDVKQLEALRLGCAWVATGDFLVLGGGSNILLTGDVEKPVIKIDIKGISVVDETEDHCTVVSGAGEPWHDFVLWCIDRNLGGLENLSLIPGQVGAAPMQNIGAYGVEIKDSFCWLKAFRLSDGNIIEFDAASCAFGYRESVFKRALKGQYIITEVAFRLSKKNHKVSVGYGAIKQELDAMGISNPGIRDVSAAVIRIRQSKLPDPKKLGNSGSFFKNPVVSTLHFQTIKARFPDVVAYPAGINQMKLAAGWLIEKVGLKGYRDGPVGVHERQALVLVHYGGGRGAQILALAQKVQKAVEETFGVQLEPEVNIL